MYFVWFLTPVLLVAAIFMAKGRWGRKQQKMLQEVTLASRVWEEAKTDQVVDQLIERTVSERIAPQMAELAHPKQEKLLAKIRAFYVCYSSTNFENFKHLRLEQPFRIGTNLTSFLTDVAKRQQVQLPTADEQIAKLGWELMNGTNRITNLDADSVVLSFFETRKFNNSYLKISIAQLPNAAVLCWKDYIVNLPTPDDLSRNGRPVTYFSLEQFVRFNGKLQRAANAMKLIGYWDEERSDWTLWRLCLLLSEDYSTLF